MSCSVTLERVKNSREIMEILEAYDLRGIAAPRPSWLGAPPHRGPLREEAGRRTEPRPAPSSVSEDRRLSTEYRGTGGPLAGKDPGGRAYRVLCGEADESFVAAEGCGEAKEGQVVAWMAFVAGAESAVSGEPRHRALDDPSAAAQSFAGLDAFAGDPDSDALTA